MNWLVARQNAAVLMLMQNKGLRNSVLRDQPRKELMELDCLSGNKVDSALNAAAWPRLANTLTAADFALMFLPIGTATAGALGVSRGLLKQLPATVVKVAAWAGKLGTKAWSAYMAAALMTQGWDEIASGHAARRSALMRTRAHLNADVAEANLMDVELAEQQIDTGWQSLRNAALFYGWSKLPVHAEDYKRMADEPSLVQRFRQGEFTRAFVLGAKPVARAISDIERKFDPSQDKKEGVQAMRSYRLAKLRNTMRKLQAKRATSKNLDMRLSTQERLEAESQAARPLQPEISEVAKESSRRMKITDPKNYQRRYIRAKARLQTAADEFVGNEPHSEAVEKTMAREIQAELTEELGKLAGKKDEANKNLRTALEKVLGKDKALIERTAKQFQPKLETSQSAETILTEKRAKTGDSVALLRETLEREAGQGTPGIELILDELEAATATDRAKRDLRTTLSRLSKENIKQAIKTMLECAR